MPHGLDPSFERPPVVETVIGAQFEPIGGFTSAHLGAFWKCLGESWPIVTDAPLLAQQLELFGEPSLRHSFQVRLNPLPSTRLLVHDRTRTRMVQIQNGRFHYNWIRDGGAHYPRFRVVRPEFDHLFERFSRFVKEEKLGELRMNQWEITYVNQLPKGSVWQSPADWAKTFGGLHGELPDIIQGSLESFSGEWQFEIKPARGRVHLEMQHGFMGPTPGIEAVVVKLTARGPIDERTSLSQGLDLGHENVVRAFVQLTSMPAKSYWGLKT